MADIFYFEDEKVWSDKFMAILKSHGHIVDLYSESSKAFRAIADNRTDRPDIAVLDAKDQAREINVGLDICTSLKKRWPGLPVIFLTTYAAGGATELSALRRGANYYIAKQKDEQGLFVLEAINSAIAIYEELDGVADTYEAGSLKVSQSLQTAWWKNEIVSLAPTEFSLVDCLASRKNQVVKYEELRRACQIQHVGDQDIDFVTAEQKEDEKNKKLRNTLASHVKSIRKKFTKLDGDPDLSFSDVLFTSHKIGYGWRPDKVPGVVND